MKKNVVLLSAVIAMSGFIGCKSGKKVAQATTTPIESVAAGSAEAPPVQVEYKVTDRPQVDLSKYPKDKDGWYTIFNGKDLTGWRGYNRDQMPAAWVINDGAIQIKGSGEGEAGAKDGGDIVFAHKFKNFELEMEWKVGKGSNSGIFYLAQEVDGEPIYISAPECQVLDNENHPDAKMGKDGNRKSSSLYDMIPAKPQNAKPAGEWNKVRIMVYKGTVVHYQNDEPVVEYHLWTKQWDDMLQASKFSKEKWPLAYELLANCGGAAREGYIGLQDHGDDVWFRNIKVKILD